MLTGNVPAATGEPDSVKAPLLGVMEYAASRFFEVTLAAYT